MNVLNIYEIAQELNKQEKSLLCYMLKKDLLASKTQFYENASIVSDEEIDLYLLKYIFNVELL